MSFPLRFLPGSITTLAAGGDRGDSSGRRMRYVGVKIQACLSVWYAIAPTWYLVYILACLGLSANRACTRRSISQRRRARSKAPSVQRKETGTTVTPPGDKSIHDRVNRLATTVNTTIVVCSSAAATYDNKSDVERAPINRCRTERHCFAHSSIKEVAPSKSPASGLISLKTRSLYRRGEVGDKRGGQGERVALIAI